MPMDPLGSWGDEVEQFLKDLDSHARLSSMSPRCRRDKPVLSMFDFGAAFPSFRCSIEAVKVLQTSDFSVAEASLHMMTSDSIVEAFPRRRTQ